MNKGYLTLVSVLVLGMISTGVALGLVWAGLGASRTSVDLLNSAKARAFAWTCAEEVLMRVRTSSTFIGTGNLVMEGGGCNYAALGGGAGRILQAEGFAQNTYARLIIEVSSTDPVVQIVRYREVPRFE